MLRKLEPEIYRQDTRPKNRHQTQRKVKPRPGAAKESAMRPKFQARVEALHCWAQFQPNNDFVAENQLRAREDYISNLALHLPEIYGETFNVERSLKCFCDKQDFTAVAEIVVRLEHIAHHVSYCHYALEILADEWRWR